LKALWLFKIAPVVDGAKLYSEKQMATAATVDLTCSLIPAIAEARCAERWFAAYTCANHEKRVASHFEARAVDHFLPVYRSERRWKDRSVRLDLPLFPGYIFVRLAADARLRVLEVPGVVRLVGFNGQPYPLPENEIESLRRGVLNELRIVPHPYLKMGSRVRIVGGPLEGAEGILVRKKNVHRVVLSLDLIARSVAVEVDLADIERLGRRTGQRAG
jgi:transcription antitermination factor NusG